MSPAKTDALGPPARGQGLLRHGPASPRSAGDACTINLVPSLLVQLLAYTEKDASDRFLDVAPHSRRRLSQHDAMFLLDHYFMADAEHMIKPLPRFWELYQRRALGRNSAREALSDSQERDLRDLQMLFNLAWIHPLAFERDDGLEDCATKAQLHRAGQDAVARQADGDSQADHSAAQEVGGERPGRTDDDAVLSSDLAVAASTRSWPARRCRTSKLPRYTGGYSDDAELHVRRAVEQHAELFGVPPRGMWPAEG